MFIITYRSYKEHYDKEVYQTVEKANHRMEQLKSCKVVDKLAIREVKNFPNLSKKDLTTDPDCSIIIPEGNRKGDKKNDCL